MSFGSEMTVKLWYWSHNFSGCQRLAFLQRADTPSPWRRGSLFYECDTRERSGSFQQSLGLRTGLASDQVLAPGRRHRFCRGCLRYAPKQEQCHPDSQTPRP